MGVYSILTPPDEMLTTKIQTQHMYCILLDPSRASTDISGDVGGQKTLRTYWKNYFEKTDTLIWVVDATDRERVGDCRHELAGLLLEEVGSTSSAPQSYMLTRRSATVGRKSASVQEQERRPRRHE